MSDSPATLEEGSEVGDAVIRDIVKVFFAARRKRKVRKEEIKAQIGQGNLEKSEFLRIGF
jgi:hypothetical protein